MITLDQDIEQPLKTIELVEQNTIKYDSRELKINVKNREVAIKNRIKKYLRPTEYEHDLMIRSPAIAMSIYKDVRKIAKEWFAESKKGVMLYDNSIYLQGYIDKSTRNKKGKLAQRRKSILVYDIGVREGKRAGEIIKNRDNILQTYFKKPNKGSDPIGIEDLITQPEIQELIYEGLLKTITKVFSLCSNSTKQKLANALDIEIPNCRLAPKKLAEPPCFNLEHSLFKKKKEGQRAWKFCTGFLNRDRPNFKE